MDLLELPPDLEERLELAENEGPAFGAEFELEGCRTRFISCFPSADHKSTVTRKNEQSISLLASARGSVLLSVPLLTQSLQKNYSLDVYNIPLFCAYHHFGNGSRGEWSTILVSETTHASANGVLDHF